MNKKEVRGTAMVLTLLDLSVRSIEVSVGQATNEAGNRLLSTHALLRELHNALGRWKTSGKADMADAGLDTSSFEDGYRGGWVDALSHTDWKTQQLAWAIVDRNREKVGFDTAKPERIEPEETVVALYGRPDDGKARGAEQ